MKLPFVLAKRFVAGEEFESAIPKVSSLNAKGIKVTLDLLGENVTDRALAEETTHQYIHLLEDIGRSGLDSTISIKLTMLGLDIDRDFALANLAALLDKAASMGQFVRIDMEGSDYTQVTIDLFQEIMERYAGHVGIVIQAYMRRSAKDIPMLAERSADIRLCKGAYKEPASVALQKMSDIRAAYKEYARILLEKTPQPRFATHDSSLVEWVKYHAQKEGIAKDRFEIQMLYGMRASTIEQLTREGYQTRVYVPFGTMWFPYYKRRLMERKENIFFVATTLFKD
jgi:proline dehydrogenase